MSTSPTRTVLAAVAAVILAVGWHPAAEAIDIEVVRDGQRQPLSNETQSQIVDQVPKLFATCSINSRDHPQIFASWTLDTLWEDVQAKDHLTVRLETPIELRAGRSLPISVDHFLIGLADPDFPAPELSRRGAHIVAYVKCSGIDLIRFVCAADIKPVMPVAYHQLCRHAMPSKQSAAPPPDTAAHRR